MNLEQENNIKTYDQKTPSLDGVISCQEILKLNESDIEKLSSLDSFGLLLGEIEDIESYKTRILALLEEKEIIEQTISIQKSVKIDRSTTLCKSLKLSPSDFYNANEILSKNYGFSINWVPSFYMPHSLGLFVGGCSLSFESGLPCILLNKGFEGRKKWLLYTKEELITHELCHAARNPINDAVFEEFFAYKLSPSLFRRRVGGCFRGNWTPVFLLGPILLVLAIQIINIFLQSKFMVFSWVLVFIYPIFLVLRAVREQNIYSKACKALSNYGIFKDSISPILFRCYYSEIKEISTLNSERFPYFIEEKKKKFLRWRVIDYRFIRRTD